MNQTETKGLKAVKAESGEPYLEDVEYSSDVIRAKIGIWAGIFFLVCIFIIDTIVQQWGVDYGYWPYLISNLCFFYGGWFLAKRRGYGPVVRILGLFNLPGLAVACLFQDRFKCSKGDLKVKAAAVLVIIVCCYLGQQHYQKQSELKIFFSFVDTIHIREGLYPSQAMPDETDFVQNQKTMRQLVNNGFKTLLAHSFRPDDVQKVSQLIFSTLSDYFIWLNYQQYLHAQVYEDLPDYLTSEYVTGLKIKFNHQVRGLVGVDDELDCHPSLIRVYYAWVMSCNAWNVFHKQCVDVGNIQVKQMNRYLWVLYSYLRAKEMSYAMFPDRPGDRFSLSGLTIPAYPKHIFSSVEIIGDSIIDLRLRQKNPDELSGKQLIFAFYKRPYRNYGRLHHYPALTCVGGDLPNKFLKSNFNVFHEWVTDAVIEKAIKQRRIREGTKSAFDP